MKNILIGIIIGIISTVCLILLIGDVDIQTDFQFGERLNKDISIIIEKNIDTNGKEDIIINAIGKGSANQEDIENELAKIFIQHNMDASSGIKVNITLDNESDFK